MTRRQAELFEFIKAFIAEKGYSPSIVEMMHHLGLASKSGVCRIMSALKSEGKITYTRHRARSIEIVKGLDAHQLSVDIMGRLILVRAGEKPEPWTHQSMYDAIKAVLAGYGIV